MRSTKVRWLNGRLSSKDTKRNWPNGQRKRGLPNRQIAKLKRPQKCTKSRLLNCREANVDRAKSQPRKQMKRTLRRLCRLMWIK